MNAAQAGEQIAPFIGRQWPDDKAVIYRILRLAENKAWNEGKWRNQTRELMVPIRCGKRGRYIVGPYDYPVLLAININSKPRDLRGTHFMFHRNGDGQIMNRNGCRWNQDVFDLGEFPIIDEEQININSGVIIGIRALGNPGPNEKVWINGSYADNQKVFTYQLKEGGVTACGCSIQKDSIDTTEGIALEVTNQFHYICNIKFGSIESIHKTVTRTPIEVVAIDPVTNKAQLIATLYPGQTESIYRRYLLPDNLCRDTNCVHGLFKIKEQQQIISDTTSLTIANLEALISLAMSIDYIYYKKDLNQGANYFLQGISILDKNKSESDSPDLFPIQVSKLSDGDMPSIFNHFS